MSQRGILRVLIVVFVITWSGFVVAAYFVAHKPLALQVADQLLNLAWTLIVTSMLLFNAIALGIYTMKKIIPASSQDTAFLVLACGIGLGELGLLGFGLAATGASHFLILLSVQIILLGLFIWQGVFHELFFQIKKLSALFQSSSVNVPVWMKWAVILAVALTFLMTFLPPAEAYDALLYHLTVPQLWLQDGGIYPHDFFQYWFPSLAEGVYVLGVGLNSEISAQQIHFAWAIAMGILLWDWSRRVWGERAAWWNLIFIISMPSLLLLASWAYTDMALSFFGVAMLYTLWQGRELNDTRWWVISAIAAGMAMGIKYTSFFMPMTAIALIVIWKFHVKKELWLELLRFGSISALTGCVWYLRNWFWMGNPFYPFLFGGRYWDEFRSTLLAGVGTGAGWDWKALISLPLTITLGYQDINGFDGNIGALFLLALPLTIWMATKFKEFDPGQKRTFAILSLFSGTGAIFWIYGYITAKGLWQTRLLFPTIIPASMLAAFAMTMIQRVDTKGLRTSFIVLALIVTSVFTNISNAGLSLVSRNPFGVMTGIVSRESYMEKFQPDYSSALQLMAQTPSNASIYSLFEPRSYSAPRNLQPDSYLDNFAHDFFLYKNPDGIVSAWRAEGYTHLILNKRGASLVLNKREEQEALNGILSLLKLISMSPNESYALYKIDAQ